MEGILMFSEKNIFREIFFSELEIHPPYPP